MIVYTGNIETIEQLNGVCVDGWKIEIIYDGSGVPFVNQETIDNPIFAEKKPIFNKLTPIKYTPFSNEND
jgi:hypothetical protein